MAKKKHGKHMIEEAQKAQFAVGRGVASSAMIYDGETSASKKVVENSNLVLPVAEIKRDLVKNLVFVVVSVSVLVLLKVTNLGFSRFTL